MYNVPRKRHDFWTAFGQYMSPIPSFEGNKVNWINYKAGIKYIYIKMDAGNGYASIGIELRHADTGLQQQYFEKLLTFRRILEDIVMEEWIWKLHNPGPDGRLCSGVYREINDVNIYDNNDWPAIISFLKPRIRGLDEFWSQVKDQFHRA